MANFLSLPGELRDLIYKCVLLEPLHFSTSQSPRVRISYKSAEVSVATSNTPPSTKYAMPEGFIGEASQVGKSSAIGCDAGVDIEGGEGVARGAGEKDDYSLRRNDADMGYYFDETTVCYPIVHPSPPIEFCGE